MKTANNLLQLCNIDDPKVIGYQFAQQNQLVPFSIQLSNFMLHAHVLGRCKDLQQELIQLVKDSKKRRSSNKLQDADI